MESILRWSLQHSTPLDSAASDKPPTSHQKIDPEIIDIILGKSDVELMKEDLAVIMDVTKSEDDRLTALDDLEMLVEQIDNANNFVKLKLWDPLLSLLTSEGPSMNIKAQILWVIGTVIQNNPVAQDEYLSLNPLPALLAFLIPSSSSTVTLRSKALYALSGLLKHNAPALVTLSFPEIEGWPKLRDALKDPDISIRRRVVFLLNTLLTPATPSQQNPDSTMGSRPSGASEAAVHTVDEPRATAEPIHANSHAAHLKDPDRLNTSDITRAAFIRHDITATVISTLVDASPCGDNDDQAPDTEFEEKTLHLLYTYVVTCDGQIPITQTTPLRQWLGKTQHQILELSFLSPTELQNLLQKL